MLPPLLYDGPVLIPHEKLAPPTLRAIVVEFVTRDGTDHSSVDNRIEAILRQLKSGQVELHFDAESTTTNVVKVAD